MGTTLTGTRISDTYDSLLKATDNGIITSSAKQITDGVGNNTPLYISTSRIGIGVSPTTTFQVSGNSKIGGDLTVTGNLLVEGTTTTVDTDTLSVKDPLIIVGNDNNTSDLVDLGFYGLYDTSGSQDLYSGLYRSASDTKFHLFKDLQEEPTTTVNTSGTGYAKADLVIGDLEAERGTFTDSIFVSPALYVSDAIIHTGDIDTKLEFLSDQIKFSTGGGFRFSINNSYSEFFTNVRFEDSIKAQFGDSQDLEIYHNGTYSELTNNTGALYIRQKVDDGDVEILSDGGDGTTEVVYFRADGNTGSAQLFHYGSIKLGTSSTGIDISGTLDVDDVISVEGSAFGRIEIGGASGGYIDLKAPNSDDYDLRIITSSGGNEVTTATGDLIFNTAETLALTIDTSQDATFEGDIILSGTVDGRDVATDGTKLDGIESGADVTDTANVTSAGALMDSELTDLAGIKAVTISTLQVKPSEGAFVNGDKTKLDGIEAGATTDQTAAEIKTAYESNSNTNAFTDADETKLNGIEASADVTDATNVLSAGAVMTSGNQSISGVKTFSNQVTIPATPSASTDAASKGYVDTKVGENNELSEVLSNGNTTGGTDIAVSAGDDITFTDTSKAYFGTSNDLQIYHDGSNSYIDEVGVGSLYNRTTLFIVQNTDSTKNSIIGNPSADVKLYYNGVKKLETTSYGINVTGAINADDYISIEGSTNPYLRIQDTTNEEYLNLYSSDNESAIVYTQDTFKISSGVDFLNQTPRLTINSSGNATFAGRLRANNWFQGADGTNTLYSAFSTGLILQTPGATANNNDSKIFFRNVNTTVSHTFDTNNGDATFAGNITTGGTNATVFADRFSGLSPGVVLGPTGAGTIFLRPSGVGSTGFQSNFTTTLATIGTNATFAGNINLPDNKFLYCGGSSDLVIGHDGSNAYIKNTVSGNLYIRQEVDNGDIIFQSDDGSGGVTEYFRVDGGITKTVFVRDTKHLDTKKALFGDQDDLQIYHDGSNSYIKDTGTGTLNLQGSTQVLISGINGQVGVQYIEGGKVGLRHANVTKLETTNTGVTVTGNIIASGDVYAEDNIYLTDTGTARGVISLDSSDRDDLNIKAISLGSLMRFYTQDTLALTLDASQNATFAGKVGINCTPSYKLEWSDGTRTGLLDTNIGAVVIGSVSNDALALYTNLTEKMRIDSSGNVGILTTSMLNTGTSRGSLTIGGSVAGTLNIGNGSINFGIYATTAESSIYSLGVMKFSVGSGLPERMRITSAGNVGIGTDSPSSKLTINTGTGTDSLRFERDGQETYRITHGTSGLFFTHPNTTALFFGLKQDGDITIHNDQSSEYVRFDNATSSVGIGTTLPSQKLETVGIIKSSGVSNSLMFSDRTTAANTWEWYSSGNNAGLYKNHNTAATVITIDSSGNATFAGQVSVGNYAIPSDHQFQIAHLGQSYARFALTNSQTGNGSSDGLIFQMESLNSIIKNQENGTLGFGTNGRETDILIDSSGNVGIGATSPNQKLHVYQSETNSQAYITVQNNRARNSAVFTQTTNGGFYTGTSIGTDTLCWQVYDASAGERMRITSDGNISLNGGILGLGKASSTPSIGYGMFHYSGIGLGIYSGAGGGTQGIGFWLNNGGAAYEAGRWLQNGNLGIGTTSPTYGKITVTESGSAYTGDYIYGGTSGSYGALRCTLSASNSPSFIDFFRSSYSTTVPVGAIVTSGSNCLYQSYSDYRMKENVSELTGALDKVNNIQPKTFNYKEDTETTYQGFIAHELQEVVPQAVSGKKDEVNEDGTPKYQGVDNSHIVPLLVGAIKELKAEIELLKTQINK